MTTSNSSLTIDKYGTKFWRNSQGQFHRTDGPAREYANGRRYWYINGQLHRTDGPAIEWEDNSKEWYINDKRLTYHDFLKSLPEHEAMYVALIHGAP